MKLALLTSTIVATSSSAFADGHYSDLFADLGPTGAAETLSEIANPTASDRLALGGAHFLSAIEGTLQTRYAYGLDTLEMARQFDIPFLRLPSEPNPNPLPFDYSVFETVFTDALSDLALSYNNLQHISSDDSATMAINVADLWLDANANDTKDPGEGFAEIIQSQFSFSDAEIEGKLPVIRFDTADAAWLSAYTQMLSGMSELILSTDVTTAVQSAYEGGAIMDEIQGDARLPFDFFSANDRPFIDALTAILIALEGQPDPMRTRAAHAHFQNALADNREFWARLPLETDNKLEFIPNDNQTSALPITFPAGIGDRWQAILTDAQAVLDGELLIPHWRLGPYAGLNMAKMFQNPPEIDLIGVFQGYTVAPYAEVGARMTLESIAEFDMLTQGNSPLFAVILN